MAGNHLFIRLDLSNGKHIGPGKIALLEAIRADGSILAASKHFGNVWWYRMALGSWNQQRAAQASCRDRARQQSQIDTSGWADCLGLSQNWRAGAYINTTGITRNCQTYPPKEGARDL
jgi:hypothetical protein